MFIIFRWFWVFLEKDCEITGIEFYMNAKWLVKIKDCLNIVCCPFFDSEITEKLLWDDNDMTWIELIDYCEMAY